MVNRKSKGTNAERELIHLFWAKQWAACRVAGSGSMKYPCPDIIASNNLRKIAVECKSTKSTTQYFTRKEIGELEVFARLFGAEPWVGVRFDNIGWYFFSTEDLKKTKKLFHLTLEEAKSVGMSFDELID